MLAGIPEAGGVVAGSKNSNGREKKSSRNSRSRSSKNPSREQNSVWILVGVIAGMEIAEAVKVETRVEETVAGRKKVVAQAART